MQRHSRLAAFGLAGAVAVGSLVATLASAAPAAAADRGWHGDHDRGRVVERRDWDDHRYDRDRDWHADYVPAYPAYPAPAYVYPAPGYVPAYPAPSNGWVHVSGPNWGIGFGF